MFGLVRAAASQDVLRIVYPEATAAILKEMEEAVHVEVRPQPPRVCDRCSGDLGPLTCFCNPAHSNTPARSPTSHESVSTAFSRADAGGYKLRWARRAQQAHETPSECFGGS